MDVIHHYAVKRKITKTIIYKCILVCIEINLDKKDLPGGFPPLLCSDTHGMILNDGHLLEKWYHPWYCGPQLHHVGVPYEQCTDRSNGISVFLKKL